MTFVQVIIKRFEGFIETHSKRNAWEVEAAEEMQKSLSVLQQYEATLKALELQQAAEEYHVNCSECDGEDVPELCPKCFPLYDAARLARWHVLNPVGTVGDRS